jgi:hypothetical protein
VFPPLVYDTDEHFTEVASRGHRIGQFRSASSQASSVDGTQGTTASRTVVEETESEQETETESEMDDEAAAPLPAPAPAAAAEPDEEESSDAEYISRIDSYWYRGLQH